MNRISLKRQGQRGRQQGQQVSVVRYKYIGGTKRRSCTITVGSISLDADPDEVRSEFKQTKSVIGCESLRTSPLTDEDFTLMAAWLIKNGDHEAAARRAARIQRIEIALLRKHNIDLANAHDLFSQAIRAVELAGNEIQERATEEAAAGRDPWATLRAPYLEVYRACEAFHEVARNAGVTKRKVGVAEKSRSP